jgi:phosphoribosylformimino-5-aminoimidazole carboxamide ribotide isomerase
MFTVYPAIDILGGNCVRLYQGDYDKSMVYDDSPDRIAAEFCNQGADWIHIVDLDGAKRGQPVNDRIIKKIAKDVSVKIEVGGGIRDMDTVRAYLDSGVSRVVLGSSAISDPDFTKEALRQYPYAVAIGLDVKDGKVAVKGWREVSGIRAEALADELIQAGARQFIYTDISRDGALKGADFNGAEQLAEKIGMPVVLSGGVTTQTELEKISEKNSGRISGVIIGRALYTGQIDLGRALRTVNAIAGKTNHPLS